MFERRMSISIFVIEMIGAKREVDRDWAEFETYATNLYARSLVKNQSSLPSRVVSIKSTSEYQQSSLDSSNNYPMEVKSITNEMTSVKKALADLHTHSEEVSYNRNLKENVYLLVDASMYEMDDGCHRSSEDVQRAKT